MQLHYQSIGSGKPLIFIHGLFGSGDNWRSIAKHFAQTYRVICVDLRNHGRSPHAQSQTYPEMAEDFFTLLTSLGIKQANLVGHSIGGKVAMEFAATYPNLLKTLSIVDIAPRAYPDEHSALFDAMLGLNLSQIKSRSDADERLASAITNTMVRQFLLTNLVKTDDGFDWRINLIGLKANYPHLLAAPENSAAFEKPSLWIQGNKSDYISPEDEARIRQQFKQAAFAQLNAGHWVHAEQPQAFIQTVDDFLVAQAG